MVSLYEPERPNPKPLNGAQFSQGTLFVPPKPSPEHRWRSHGYSPERRAEISAVVPKSIGISTKWGQLSSPMYPAGETVKSKRGDSRTMRNLRTATRNTIVDTLARSTMPAEDLGRNTPKMKVAPMSTAYGRMRSKGMIEGGRFVTPTQGDITLHPLGSPSRTRSGAEHTLLHEIGHHVDYEEDPTSFHHTAKTEQRIHRGVAPSLEGAAEGYAHKHHVPRRDEPPMAYRHKAAYQDLHGHPSFHYHFKRVSGVELSEAMGTHMGSQFQEPMFNADTPEVRPTIRVGRGNGPWMWKD